MKSTSSCCGSTTTPCESTIAELPRYYPRQLITPDDLTLEQNYFRDRMRRHNRLLHGWGVVCGALVCPVITTDANKITSVSPWQVQVNPGYALGPYGDEIILDCARTVDLRTNGVSGVTGDPCVNVPDPWCSQVTVPRNTGTLYIAVKYKQSMTRPVRVQPIGCGCDDNTCECSRLHDGYEIGILNCCPDDGQTPPKPGGLFTGDVPSCPDCPPQPWVVLAAVQVEADGTISSIDNCACRRLVASFSKFWWQCNDAETSLAGPKPATNVTAGQTSPVVVTGTNLDPAATYTFGNGILVAVTTPAGAPQTTINLNVTPDANAAAGLRSLVAVNKDCSTVTLADAINVVVATPTRQATPNATVSKTAPAKGGVTKTSKKGTDTTSPQE